MKNIIITKGTKDSVEMWVLGLFIVVIILIGFIYGK
jgi:uncharacterized membrane protein